MDEPNYRKLAVWQKAHKNSLLIINLLKDCNYKYSKIIDQCLGAATSIGANIAEGNSVPSNKHRESYFQIALNSSYEFDNWIQIFKDSKLISDSKIFILVEKENIEVIKILSKILTNLRS